MRVPEGYDVNSGIGAYMQKAMKAMEKGVELVRQNHKIAVIAEANGFECDWWPGDVYTVEIKATVAQLRKIRELYGKLKVHAKYAGAHDDEVQVTLISDDFPQLRVTYTTVIKEGAKCKVVEQVSTYRTLVCER